MEKTIYRIIIALFVLAAAGYAAFYTFVPGWDAQYEQSTIPAELEGKVFHWRYEIGWDFRVQLDADGLHWEGVAGDFEGQTVTTDPRYTKIRDNLYFVTWNIPNIGYDSIVLDFENSRVYAHSKGNSQSIAVEGVIHCNGMSEVCEPPRRD